MLPVEVAFRGPEDMDEDTIAQLAAMFGPLSGLDVLTVPHLPHEMRFEGFQRNACARPAVL